ncbi:MAG: prolyl oligopeptidase family serine peptidase [Bacteroidota bacterium]
MLKKTALLALSAAAVYACAPDTKKTAATGEVTEMKYPQTATCDSSHNYFGTEVKDPYGWLEDDYSDKTTAWVKEQNEMTQSYLQNIPQRSKIHKRLTEVWNYEKLSAPFKKGGVTYFFKNDGVQNQYVLYKLDKDGKEVVVIDPNKLSKDGTVALGAHSFSKDGKYLAYALSESGSDWESIHVMDATTGKILNDKVEWVKFSSISWENDGFYYSRYDAPKKGQEYSEKNEFHKVYYHQLGKDQKDDKLIYQDSKNGQKTFGAITTKDEKYLIMQSAEGTSGSSLYIRKTGETEFIAADPESFAEYTIVGSFKDKLYVLTTKDAANSKLVAIDPLKPAMSNWKTIIPETENYLQSVTIANGKLLVVYLEKVSNHLYTYTLDGKRESEIKLPEYGTINGIEADENESTAYVNYSNFITPSSIYKLDLNANKAALFRKPNVKFNSEDYTTSQVFYPSKDGTKIPMFITHKKGLKLDGTNPTFLYAYGGFNISIQPAFAIDFVPFLENGGIYAVANIRGGSEFGEKWHTEGIKLKKQNVFDDFIAAAEYLIKEKYTSSSKLAVHGRSNGGLLIGAVLTQRPDLFAVTIPKVGVLDMLRYHKFTIGWAWASDYGRSDDSKEMFDYLYKYSPLHNVKKTSYPATLVVTGDHDDRVVPAHSFKFAATLQANQTGTAPVLLRIDTNGGHGAGKPLSKQIDEFSDQWAFVFKHLKIN